METKTLKKNLETIHHNLSFYLQKTPPIKIMAVSKQQAKPAIEKAQNQGLTIFGENKVQEAEQKKDIYSNKIELHWIGHLQSNKVKKAVNIFNVIQSVDSYKIANKINKEAKLINKNQRIYIQVNIGNDPNKHGFLEEGIEEEIRKISVFQNITIEGIMTILPFEITNQEKEKLYIKTKKLKDIISVKIKSCVELSMGMSSDYLCAAQCGATMVRIGTSLFGARPKWV